MSRKFKKVRHTVYVSYMKDKESDYESCEFTKSIEADKFAKQQYKAFVKHTCDYSKYYKDGNSSVTETRKRFMYLQGKRSRLGKYRFKAKDYKILNS